MSATEPGVLQQLREELVDTVTGITTYPFLPGRAQLPCAFVLAGSPYVEAGVTFGDKTVRLLLVLATQNGTNAAETDELDRLIEQCQSELQSAGWLVEQVDQPEIQNLNGAEILATAIHVATDATFN